jgi:CyaY protein
VINLQKPLQEVWLAAKAGGFHYRFVEGQWQDTKGQGEFFEQLSRQASTQAEMALRFGN